MKLASVEVLSNNEIMPRTHVLELKSPELGSSSIPGQFLHLKTGEGWDPLLRRPMSIFRIRPEGVSIMVRSVGRGSDLLARRRPGERLDCLGPLGRGFSPDRRHRRLLMVGGGYGVAPLIGLAEQALRWGAEITLLVGAASADFVFPSALVPPAVEYQAATIDGTLGHHGLVTELVPGCLDWADAVFACGPTGMLESVTKACSPRSSVPVQLAME